jgi:hypothetical protein
MDLQVVGCVGMDWIELAQDKDRWLAHMNEVMNSRGSLRDVFISRSVLKG